MNTIKASILLLFFIFLTNCGYSPLLNLENINFNIYTVSFEGDRKVNNVISKTLLKYQNNSEATKNYKIEINTNYNKIIINKDSKGNPKNYDIQVTANVKISLEGFDDINKVFSRNNSLSAQSKKIYENELEQKLKKNLAGLIGEDIIFFLINQ